MTELAPMQRKRVSVEECLGPVLDCAERLESFSELSVRFLAELSDRILKDPAARRNPDFAAFGFWARKANLARLIPGGVGDRDHDRRVLLVPRGVALHIAPANVDTVFLYSFALSLLAGNANIVRLSSRLGESLTGIVDHVRALLSGEAWAPIARQTRLITYARDPEINAWLSLRADVRVLWGGNETVTSFRLLPTRPDAKDLTFPDRFSYCVVHARRYLDADQRTTQSLAERFYADAYVFEQKACSSPSRVYFVGSLAECQEASGRFWERLEAVLAAKRPTTAPATEMEHLVFAYQEMAAGHTVCSPVVGQARVSRLHFGDPRFRPAMCGGGMFVEVFLESLDELRALVEPSDQTLSYFGFQSQELVALAQTLRGKGISRIVPIGQALSFDANWDGYDLLRELCKTVTVV